MKIITRDIDKSWTLFLDRDGVINERIVDDYVKSWQEFRFLPGVKESIAVLSGIFGRVIVVTNQQGVGKGWMTEKELSDVHHKMKEEITASGGNIDAVYYCTKLKSEKDNCRKPAVTMFEWAMRDFPEMIPEKCIMVGDSESDMVFGKNAGMFTVFVGEEYDEADLVVPDLKSFAAFFDVNT